MRHQLPGTGCIAVGLDTPAGNFGNVAVEGRLGSVAAHTGKHSIVPVHWEDMRRPGTDPEASVPAVVMGRDVVDCSLRKVFFLCSSEVVFVPTRRACLYNFIQYFSVSAKRLNYHMVSLLLLNTPFLIRLAEVYEA